MQEIQCFVTIVLMVVVLFVVIFVVRKSQQANPTGFRQLFRDTMESWREAGGVFEHCLVIGLALLLSGRAGLVAVILGFLTFATAAVSAVCGFDWIRLIQVILSFVCGDKNHQEQAKPDTAFLLAYNYYKPFVFKRQP